MTTVRSKYLSGLLTVAFALATGITLCAPAFGEDSHAEDTKILRAQIDQYEKAFAAGNAKTIADMWTKDATFQDSEGVEHHGRDEIGKLYSNFFADNGGQPIKVEVEKIDYPSPNVAIEQGVSRLLQAPSPDTANRYTVVHVKENGQWLMASVTETPYTPVSSSEYLKPLSWLIGDWNASNSKGKVRMNARWVADGHFILCTYRTDGTEKEKIADAQLIGWDPARKQIFSSNFSSGGGFGGATWSRDGKNWNANGWAVQPNGTSATATYILRPGDKDSFTWQSTNRSLDGDPVPDTDQLRVVRDTSSK